MALALRTVHGSLLTLMQMEVLQQQRSLLPHSLQILGLIRPWKALSRFVGLSRSQAVSQSSMGLECM